jgi:hypothetical protein
MEKHPVLVLVAVNRATTTATTTAATAAATTTTTTIKSGGGGNDAEEAEWDAMELCCNYGEIIATASLQLRADALDHPDARAALYPCSSGPDREKASLAAGNGVVQGAQGVSGGVEAVLAVAVTFLLRAAAQRCQQSIAAQLARGLPPLPAFASCECGAWLLLSADEEVANGAGNTAHLHAAAKGPAAGGGGGAEEEEEGGGEGREGGEDTAAAAAETDAFLMSLL